MRNAPLKPALVATLACLTAFLGGCASPGTSVQVVTQASSSSFFTLGPPGVYKSGDALQLAGRVCRRARSTLLSPSRVRLEHVGATGAILDIAHARVAAIYANADQACTDYSTRVRWQIAESESVRACFDRARACPDDTSAKAVVNVPLAPPALSQRPSISSR